VPVANGLELAPFTADASFSPLLTSIGASGAAETRLEVTGSAFAPVAVVPFVWLALDIFYPHTESMAFAV
jgi:hypothetical protein